MDNIIPLNYGRGYGGEALSAGAGAFFGSVIGNGNWGGRMNGNGYGDWGNPWHTQSHGHLSDQIQLNNLNTTLDGIGGQISQLNTAILQGQGQAQVLTCQGTATTVDAIKDGNYGLQSTLCQGFGGINQTVERVGYQNALQATTNANAQTLALTQGFNQLSREMSDCCCSTNANITAQGNETRALMTQQHYEGRISTLQDRLSDRDAMIAKLQNEAFTTNAIAQLSASTATQFNVVNTTLATILAKLPTTTTTTTTTPAA